MNKISDTEQLKIHEWLFIITFIGVLGIITVITCSSPSSSKPLDNPHYVSAPEIEIFIQGAVEFPGIYRVKQGALVKDVLTLAKPLATADLRRLNLEGKLRNGRVIKVPVQKQKKKCSSSKKPLVPVP